MRFIGSVIEKLQRHPKRIVFPEGTEPRVIQAARQFYSLRLGVPILLGDRSKVKEAAERLNVSLEGVRITRSRIQRGTARASSATLRTASARAKGIKDRGGARRHAQSELLRRDDGRHAPGRRRDLRRERNVSGSTLRPLFQIIKVAPKATTASSCMVMEVEDTKFGDSGVIFMADCGVIPDPNVEQLTDIAISTARLARQLVGQRARVALLSYSTKGSASAPTIGKMQAATALAQQRAHEMGL